MTIPEVAGSIGAALAGVALGAFFFASLWWTVRRMATGRHPALMQIASLLARMAITIAGFALVGAGDLPRLLACLAGFVIARVAVTRYVQGRASSTVPLPTEVRHAARP
jgi:F1F0 ATPase subunit 2